jgi:hypothetical protein
LQITFKQLTVTEPAIKAAIFQRCHNWKHLEILPMPESAAIANLSQL